MGTKNNPGKFDCYTNAKDDEPIFVLLARDPLAPQLVRKWAQLTKMRAATMKTVEKSLEATNCANAMEKWKLKNPDV